MLPKKGPKAPGGLTLTRAIGPQDIKLLNKLTSDPGGAGIFSSIGLTSCQLEELGCFNFKWEDLVKKTGVTPETLKLIQETFRLHLVATAADGWVEKPCWVEKPSTSAAAAAAATSEGSPSIATESDNSKRGREYEEWIVEKFKKHKNAAADMERQDKVGLRMWACFSAQRAIVSLQVVRKGSQYLCDDRFKDWLKVEGEGEGMKMWCWVCHAYRGHGATDSLGTETKLPSREEKLIKHAQHERYLSAMTTPRLVELQGDNRQGAHDGPC